MVKTLQEINRIFYTEQLLGDRKLRPPSKLEEEKPNAALILPEQTEACSPATESFPAPELRAAEEKLAAPQKRSAISPVKAAEKSARPGPKEEAKPKKKLWRKLLSHLSTIVFYAAIAAILITAAVYAGGKKEAHSIFGYSYFTVVSSSMQDEIPMGSLVLTKRSDPENLKVGDDVTYIRADNSTVTHKIVEIFENYNDSGARGFQTKGVNNPEPDHDIVFSANIIGKVVWSTPKLGAVLSFIAERYIFALMFFGAAIVISIGIGAVVGENKKNRAVTAADPETESAAAERSA